ncbi:MAG TPA: 4-hydroxybenzoate octaprenyltransferase [Azospirillaceae bacterium]|nr:4-hydroxybenzoate octaprenyltransferase [Azospirillaceae bacterium]
MSVTAGQGHSDGGRRDGAGHTDIAADGWVDRWLPAAARPYARLARLDRPIGTWLLLFPCWWSIALAAPAGGWPDWWLMALFGVGAVVMRGAGCTVNDILDRDIDARVERTRARPIPSGQVTVPQALGFLGLQLLLGLLVLVQLDRFAVLLGVASLALVFTYPLMKRVTWWPQAFLGLTFNWGALMGWAAVTGGLDTPALLLYAGGILWTLGYDTVYAHQDREDDAHVGVKSTALLLGPASRRWVGAFFAGAFALWTAALVERAEPVALVVPLAMAGLVMWRQVRDWDMNDPADSLATFKDSRNVGWLVLIAVIAGVSTAPEARQPAGGGGGPPEPWRSYNRVHPPFQLVSDPRVAEADRRPLREQLVRGPVGLALPQDRPCTRSTLAPEI